jgi:UDP-4-amino-4,6-dideoxy-L-N-acetyl-beta-L-altrosamine transaminase
MNFIPYSKQFIDDEDIQNVISVLKSDFLTTGDKIPKFEEKLCHITNSKYCVVVSNGTTALHLASLCLLNKNDKVLTTPNSFLATANSILYVNAEPIFVDINNDGNINLDLCEELIKKDQNIKAIYAVHFSGNPVEQKKLKYLKEKYNIKILEDCSHSLGAYDYINDEKIISGSSKYSDCSTLSFHPVKQITTGEGGAITTNDKSIYDKLLKLRSHGMTREKNEFKNIDLAFTNNESNIWYYEMQDLGFNYRLTDIQASLGISQLNKLNKFIERRKEIAKYYDSFFKDNEIIKPLYSFKDTSSYHLYVVIIDFEKLNTTRNDFMKSLLNNDIGSQVHYIPINSQPYYKKLGYEIKEQTNMNNYYKKCLSIPLYPSMSDNDVVRVCSNILELIK